MQKAVDYIIVGQGLAGSALALQLINSGKKILVVDQPSLNTSSLVAAGLFNPFTGKRMAKKTWLADEIFPKLYTFYRQAEAITKQTFFYPIELYRPFISVEEQNEWMGRSEMFASYIEKIYTHSAGLSVNDEFGGLLMKQCGYLNTSKFIEAIRAIIKNDNYFLEENFNPNELQLDNNVVAYKGYTARHVIFCEGEYVSKNPWFNWLPVIRLKGETLKIQTSYRPQQIINRGVYIVPSTQNELTVGSTYDFDDNARYCTPEARIELETKLKELVNFSFEITDQQWGMRPTTPDRRPVIGAHPEHQSLIIFNGLGTKGVSLAPYFSEQLIDWLENGEVLNKEVNVNRYKSLYSKITK